MKQPEAYIQEGQETKVCFLNKSLYRLKKHSRQWYKWFNSFMIKARYNRCEYDSYIYFKQNYDLTYLLFYVDDMLITAINKTQSEALKLS